MTDTRAARPTLCRTSAEIPATSAWHTTNALAPVLAGISTEASTSPHSSVYPENSSVVRLPPTSLTTTLPPTTGRSLLFSRVQEDELRRLIDKILAGGAGVHASTYEAFPGDDLFSSLRPKGLPIGNLTSQFWANVYMNPFDQYVKRQLRCKGYLRYVDDCAPGNVHLR